MNIIWNVIASVLLLGNIEFDDSTLTNSKYNYYAIRFH